MNYRFMRCILFFDLPSVTKSDLRDYRKFTKTLKTLGFVMYQESVYTKLCLNETVVDSSINELKKHLPKEGQVSILTITEKQFSSIKNVLGESISDVIISDERIIKL